MNKNLRFGFFEFDPLTGELRRRGMKIRLQEQPSQVLTVLLEHPGELVTREQLQNKLWASDTFVAFADSINSAIRKLRLALNDSVENPRFVETVSRHGYRFIAPVEQVDSPLSLRTTVRPETIRIAVLPFENLSAKAGQQHFVDGLTDALITEFLKIPTLTPVSGSAVWHHGRIPKMLLRIARERGVDVITEGTVVCCGEGIRVTVRLFETATGQYLWGSSYECKLRHTLESQRELSRLIVQEISTALIPKDSATLGGKTIPQSSVYDAYLRGRYFFSKRNFEALKKAAQSFQEAIDKQPDYAQAYVGLADCYNLFSWYGLLNPIEAFTKARAAASEAIKINDTLAEAHTALACAVLGLEWEWSVAETEFRKAIGLNPYYALGHQRYAEYLLAVGRPEDAIAEVNRGLEIEPLSLPMNAVLGRAYSDSRKYDRAIEQCGKTVALDPTFAMGHFFLGLAHIQAGAFEAAVADELMAKFSGGPPLVLGALGCAYATANKRHAAVEVFHELMSLSKDSYVSPYGIAMIFSGLGEKDRAFEWLGKAYEQRDAALTWLKLDPQFDALRSDARLADLIRRMGLRP